MSKTPKPKQPTLGIECRKCGCCHMPTVYTKRKKYTIVRLRECRNCGYRMITREQA